FFQDPSASQTVGTNPISLITGLFNADTDIDVAVANWGSGNVSILLNNYTPLAYALKMNVKENTLTLPEIERSTWLTFNGTYGPLNYIIVSGPTNGTFLETNGAMSNTLVPPQLRYQANTQMNGKDLIVFYVQEATNDIGTITNKAKTSKWAKVELTILPINDPPNFALASNNVDVLEDAKKTSVTNFAIDLDRGSGVNFGDATNAPHWKTEKGQAIVFRLTNNMSNIFKSQPAITDKGLLTFEPLLNKYGTATVGVVMYDKGGTLNGGKTNEPLYDKTFTISLIQSNDVPVINKILTNITKINEDGSGRVTFVVNDVETAREDLTYRVINITNTTIFPDVTGPSVDAGTSTNFIWSWDGTNRTVTFYPAANQYGTNHAFIQVDDGTNTTNTAVGVVVFSVASVNDAPTFTPGGDVNVIGTTGVTQTFPGWATDMVKGPANESAQTLTFVAKPAATTAFATGGAPAINATTGDLTFTPKVGVFGTYSVSVYLKDNGATASPNKPNSTTNTFNIIITP
ncbi:MAG: hypothetical protein HZA89_11300, partial [Verrucomicrobia bacterium]|nr:hypothetical protein [Verrucomicrobiota bacterium]